METFIQKLLCVFNVNTDNCLKKLKDEILEYLIANKYNKIDYKSVGALFGLSYSVNSDIYYNLIDIIVEHKYNFYELKKFTEGLVIFICNRKLLTNFTPEQVYDFFGNDTKNMLSSIIRVNDKKKFQAIKQLIWKPLYMNEIEKKKIHAAKLSVINSESTYSQKESVNAKTWANVVKSNNVITIQKPKKENIPKPITLNDENLSESESLNTASVYDERHYDDDITCDNIEDCCSSEEENTSQKKSAFVIMKPVNVVSKNTENSLVKLSLGKIPDTYIPNDGWYDTD